MSILDSNSGKSFSQEGGPVMCCHPADGGASARLVRALPINPRRGRSDKRRMSIKKFFRVTPKEDAAIASNATASGLEPSSYLRVQALGKAKVRRCRRIRADWDELRRCMGVINKAGNAVNQLVLVLRRFGGSPEAANAALAELIAAARAVVAALKGL